MKKIVCLLLVLLLSVSLVCPVLAVDHDFVPSISQKGSPRLIPFRDGKGDIMRDAHGCPIVGLIQNAEGEILATICEEHCLVVTSVPEAEARTTAIPEDARQLLLRVYQAITDGSMKVPFSDANAVIRELLDVSFLCEEHPKMLEPEGIVLVLNFDLGVAADVAVEVLTYKNEAWNPIVSAVNNGDGTVTCTFEHLCPVAFGVAATTQPEGTPATGDDTASDVMLWSIVMAVSVCAAAALTVVYFRKRSAGK